MDGRTDVGRLGKALSCFDREFGDQGDPIPAPQGTYYTAGARAATHTHTHAHISMRPIVHTHSYTNSFIDMRANPAGPKWGRHFDIDLFFLIPSFFPPFPTPSFPSAPPRPSLYFISRTASLVSLPTDTS